MKVKDLIEILKGIDPVSMSIRMTKRVITRRFNRAALDHPRDVVAARDSHMQMPGCADTVDFQLGFKRFTVMTELSRKDIEEMFKQVDRFSVIEYRQVVERQVGQKKPANGMKLSQIGDKP